MRIQKTILKKLVNEAGINKAWIKPIVNLFNKQKQLLGSTGKLNPASLSGLKNRFANRLANASGMSLPEAMKHLV